MAACSAGCYPCYAGGFGSDGQHRSCCCRGSSCGAPQSERYDAEAERQSKVEKELRDLALACALELAVRAAKEESAQDKLRQLAEQQAQEEDAEQIRAMIEARRVALLERMNEKERQLCEELERPPEQKPKVVHIRAARAKPITQTKKVMHET